MFRPVARLSARFGGGGGGRGGGRGYSRSVRFDGSASGYVFAALIGSIVGFSIGQQANRGSRDKETHKGGKQHKQEHKAGQHAPSALDSAPAVTAISPASGPSSFPSPTFVPGALPFSSPPIQPWTPPALDDGSALASLPLLTSLTAEQVAAHPLLQAIGPFGLPALPFRSSGGAPSPPVHLTSPLLLRQTFLSAWNSKTHTPDWCLQMITDSHQSTTAANSTALDVSRDHSSFKSDPLIPSPFQPSSSSYRHSGWDRGHMVPAADVSGVIGSGQDALDESFQWSNICPQDSRLNRGYWAQLEHHVRKLARSKGKKRGDTVFVVTGPLWIPEQVEKPAQKLSSRNNNDNTLMEDRSDSLLSLDLPALNSSSSNGGSNGVGLQLRAEVLGSVPSGFVTVPTHFFKVVLVVPADASASASAASSSFFASSSASSPLQLAAFIVPNAPVPLATPLRSFQVPLEHVEMYAGWQMFGRLQRAATNGKRGNNAQVRDLCADGGCEMKIKDFAFNRKQAQAL